jgi:hypothetical protein
VRVGLTRTGLTPNFPALHDTYAVLISRAPPRFAPRAIPAGPVAGANFKGLSGLQAGPFEIGFGATKARTYYLPD